MTNTFEHIIFDPYGDNINYRNSHFIVRYYLETNASPNSGSNLKEVAWNLAIGQSVGNPNVRNKWETEDLYRESGCKVLADPKLLSRQKSGFVDFAFPIQNIDFTTDGIAHLLVNLMGGQLDIDIIDKCHLLDIQFPDWVEKKYFLGPKFGISGVRKFTGVPKDKPILGAIVKPKIGITPEVLLDMVKELADGGVNFIKEDEIMSNPIVCPLEKRVPLISKYLEGRGIAYAVSIHSDPAHLLKRVKFVHDNGGNGVHINFWCGMGMYKSVRELDLPIFVHFQKSGDKILTNKNHDFHIDWRVICKLATLMGADFMHAGMIGGYYKWPEQETIDAVNILRKGGTVPALSCGFHPGLTDWVTKSIGHSDYMANVGGAIHGHPNGSKAGALAMRQSIDKEYGDEYYSAIKKWGVK